MPTEHSRRTFDTDLFTAIGFQTSRRLATVFQSPQYLRFPRFFVFQRVGFMLGTVEFRQWLKQRAWESEPFAVDASSYCGEMASNGWPY